MQTEPSITDCANLWGYYKACKASGFVAMLPMLYAIHYINDPNAMQRIGTLQYPAGSLERRYGAMRWRDALSVPMRADMAEFWPLVVIFAARPNISMRRKRDGAKLPAGHRAVMHTMLNDARGWMDTNISGRSRERSTVITGRTH